jgi:uncharacterized membrane protein (DUF2068 family)
MIRGNIQLQNQGEQFGLWTTLKVEWLSYLCYLRTAIYGREIEFILNVNLLKPIKSWLDQNELSLICVVVVFVHEIQFQTGKQKYVKLSCNIK